MKAPWHQEEKTEAALRAAEIIRAWRREGMEEPQLTWATQNLLDDYGIDENEVEVILDLGIGDS